MEPNCGNFLGIFGLAVTAQNCSGLFVWNLALKCMLEIIKAGNRPLDRP